MWDPESVVGNVEDVGIAEMAVVFGAAELEPLGEMIVVVVKVDRCGNGFPEAVKSGPPGSPDMLLAVDVPTYVIEADRDEEAL